jgi:hypothetical protein
MMTRTWITVAAALGCTLFASAAAPGGIDAQKQRIAIQIKLPLNAPKGTFTLLTLTPGSLDLDTGSTTFTSGPTPVFSGRIVGGQRVDRFRGTTTLTSRRGTLVLRLQQDFVSAGNSYQIATGTWSVVGGTGQYVGLVGGGRSALVRPPSGKYGFASHEGFVSKR